MALASLKNRIRKAQERTHAGEDLGIIAELLAQGAYYDELTDEEKKAYCTYYGTERETLEEISGYFHGGLHFKIATRTKPLTKAELSERIKENEAFINEVTEAYNSPEEKAKREAWYQELKEIGRKREAAHARGEDLNKYPLPWEREVKNINCEGSLEKGNL